MYHLLLCDEFSAERAYKIGLIQEVVQAGQQVERAMALAEIIAGNAPLRCAGHQGGRAAVHAKTGEATAVAFIPEIRARVLDTADAREGIRSFLGASRRGLSRALTSRQQGKGCQGRFRTPADLKGFRV